MMRGMHSKNKRHRIADLEQIVHSSIDHKRTAWEFMCGSAVGDKDHISW